MAVVATNAAFDARIRVGRLTFVVDNAAGSACHVLIHATSNTDEPAVIAEQELNATDFANVLAAVGPAYSDSNP